MSLTGVLRFTSLCATIPLFSACSQSNNFLLGRVEAAVGTHTVVVTDCYRTSVPQPEKVEDAGPKQPVYRFTPCRDADVLIRGDELIVNSQSYGRLKPNDDILVDHGVVSVNHRQATRIAGK